MGRGEEVLNVKCINWEYSLNKSCWSEIFSIKDTASDSIKHPVLFFYAYEHFRANLHPVENVMLPRREPIKGFFLKMPFPI